MSESNAATSSSSAIDEMSTLVDVLLEQTRDLFAGVSYEILIKPRVQGLITQILINEDNIDLQGNQLPNNPPNRFNQKADEVAKLQHEYRVLAENAHNEYHRLKEAYKDDNFDVELIRRQGTHSWKLKPDAVPWPARRPSSDSSDSQYSSMTVEIKPECSRQKKYPVRRLRRRLRYDSTYGSHSSDSSETTDVPQESESEEELPEPKKYLTKIRRNPLSYYMDQSSDD